MTEIVLNLLGSTLLGAVMSIWAQYSKDKSAQREFELKIMSGKAEAYKSAREYNNKGFTWTRRIIALTATFAVILLPKIAAFFGTDVWYPTAMMEGGFWFFTEPKEVITWTKMSGVIITPIDVHIMASVVGLYFGGSITKR